MTAVHIHAPPPTDIRIMVLFRGYRSWRETPHRPRSVEGARRTACLILADAQYEAKAVRVLLCYEWYGPHVAFEAKKVTR